MLFALLSCDKESGRVRNAIEFSVIAPDALVSKSEVTQDRLIRHLDSLYIYGVKSDGVVSTPVVGAPGAPLIYDAGRGVWNPKIYTSGGNSLLVQDLQWDENYYYRFYGFAYSSNANVASSAQQGKNLIITNNTYGRQFTVTQPAEGDGSQTIDYLLSSLVAISPSDNYPVVPIQLEHAMARVDVDVQIAHAMFNQAGCLVDNIIVKIHNIKREATMLCLEPKVYGEEGTNLWYITFNDQQSLATYTVNVTDPENNIEGSNDNVTSNMSFIAIPVTNSEMGDYILTLEYKGKSSNTLYQYTFALKDFSPAGWVNGHKVKYVLTIDNSIHLKGTITDYEDVDYIEGVIVPDINY